MISFEKLDSLFEYLPETGQLKRKVTVSPNAVVGSIAGVVNSNGYVKVGVENKVYAAHMIVWTLVKGVWPTTIIDHVNGVKSDNREDNLREADTVRNAYNQVKPRNNKSGYRGVYLDTTRNSAKQWKASCSVNGKRSTIGYFLTAQLAHEALVKFRELHHGEFANNE